MSGNRSIPKVITNFTLFENGNNLMKTKMYTLKEFNKINQGFYRSNVKTTYKKVRYILISVHIYVHI